MDEFRKSLIAALGLSPAEGADTVTDEQILSAQNGETDQSAFRDSLIAALGLAPGEGETAVGDEVIIAKIGELVAAAGTAGDTANALATANADLEKVRGEYQELFAREEAARRAVEEAAVDEILAQFADRLTTPEAKARIRTILLTDRAAGTEILNGLPQPTAAQAVENPPAPVHKNGDEEKTATPEEKHAEAEKLIADLRKTKPAFKLYNDAREEIRRLRPDLFS